jgi:hypothetical protein
MVTTVFPPPPAAEAPGSPVVVVGVQAVWARPEYRWSCRCSFSNHGGELERSASPLRQRGEMADLNIPEATS